MTGGMMSGGEQTVPRHVLRFEILLYASLLIDALSYPFRDRPDDISPAAVTATNLVGAGLIGLFFYLVWLAARKRRNWARWALLVSLVLSILSLAAVLGQDGWDLATVLDVVSSALTAWGLYSSFTGDARDWFTD